MKKHIALVLGLLLSCSGFSQLVRLEGSIKTDTITANMGQFIIYSLPDSSLVKGGYLDSTYFSAVFKPGEKTDFYVKISAFEYQDTLVSFTVSDSVVNLGTIELSKSKNLGTVDVVWLKPEFQRTMDGIKVNVEGTNLQTLNTLFDVLVASPKLTSPDDERIEIIGKGSPLILVDRQAIISNDELKAIPANMVQSIEIITNPSAKYKAQGRGSGVIEVYTKNFHLEGYNMTISSDAGINSQVKPTGGLRLGLNVKRNKLSLNAFIGGNYSQANNFGYSDGYATDDSQRELDSEYEGDSWNTWQFYNVKAAYQISRAHRLTFGVRGHGSLGSSDNISTSEFLTSGIVDTYESSNSDNDYVWLNNSGFVNYLWETDSSGSTFEINLNAVTKLSGSSGYTNAIYQNNLLGTNQSFDIQTESKDNPLLGELRANYEHVFDTTGWKLNIGGSFNLLFNGKIYDQYNLNNDSWIIDPNYSNSYDYQEQITAVFTEVTKSWKKFGVRAGLRVERTDLNGYSNSLDKEFIDSSYTLPFPSASIMFEPKEMIGITLSYSSGIYRPQFSSYDPFVRIEDSLSIEYGNPYLRPELEHSVSLDLDLFYAYNLSLSYGRVKDSESSLQFVDDSSFLVISTPWNAKYTDNFSASLSLPLQLNWLTGWNSFWVDYSKHYFTDEFQRPPFDIVTYGFYSYMNFRLKGDFNIGNRLSLYKWGSPDYVSNSRLRWGIRVTKKMMNNNFQVYIDVENIIPPKSTFEMYGSNFVYSGMNQYEFTSFKLGFFFKFGRLKQSTNIQESNSGQSDRI